MREFDDDTKMRIAAVAIENDLDAAEVLTLLTLLGLAAWELRGEMGLSFARGKGETLQ